ncbi:MAG: tetratricopeptide repeat protein, partial [Candidatus Brocadia sp.]
MSKYRNGLSGNLTDMYHKVNTTVFLLSTFVREYLYKVVFLFLIVSFSFPCHSAWAVTMQGKIYKTTSKKHSARKLIKAGNAHYKRGRYERAVKAYNNSIARYPDYFEAWDGLGNALYCLGDYNMA